jgi:HAD superfamily hydrolase (TIGR01509 family)
MTLPHPVAAVVFDMDGLLFDTERLYGLAGQSAARELGCELAADVFTQLIGTTWQECRRILLTNYGPAYPFEELEAVWMRHFGMLAETGLELKPGALELLDLLDALDLPRAIATSSSRKTVDHHLAAHGLAERFTGIVAAGDYAAGKPAPDPFLKAAERLGVDPRRCLALEDSPNGVRSAATAGMMTVMVPDLVQPTVEVRGLCATVATSLLEVPALVRASFG